MTHARLSISDAVAKAWQITLKNFGFTAGLVVILFFLSLLSETLRDDSTLASLLIMIIEFIIGIGVIKITLILARGEKPEYKELYSNYKYLWNYFVANVLYGLLIVAGLIIFVLPGIYFLIKYTYVPFVVIDQNVPPLEAFRLAGELTKGHWWDVFLLMLVIIGIFILGVLALVVGLLWAYPTALITIAIVYLQLREHNHTT